MGERVSTIEIYDILVKKNETTFYANDVALKIKLEYETMYDNIWVGCLFPDFYEDIDYIPFEIASDSNGPTI